VINKPLGEQYWHRHKNQGGTESWEDIARAEGKSYESVRNVVKRWRQRKDRPAPAHPAPQYEGKTPDDLTLDEYVELTRRTQEAVESVDPIFVNDTISIDADAPIGIIFVSCAHIGSRYVNHKAFQELLEKVLDIPRLYWFALGDDTEGMTAFFDVASAHEQALADPRLQRRMLALILDKLAAHKKLLCGFAGQHGADWERRKRGADPIKQMYLDRKVRYFDGQAYIKLDVGGQLYRLFAGHQLPGSSMYNRVHAQKRAALWKAPTADVVIQGDKHTYAVSQESIDTFEYLAGERESYLRWLVQVGAAKTGLDPYTIKTWSPAVWDWPILIFRNDRHSIAQAADLDLAKLMLNAW
jgi:hypothetical protein